MPKIEAAADSFFEFLGKSYSEEELETVFPVAKAELDGWDRDEGIIKIELNDTNRPDLWSTAGLARQLRTYKGGDAPLYDFFSNAEETFDSDKRVVQVHENIQKTRPYIVGFSIAGKPVDEATLKDLIQTQEKLCWNFGRKRKSIAMGVYRSDLIEFPVQYFGADPDAYRFVPLQMEEELSLREIIEKHPKGREFGPIVANDALFPFITDNRGKVLSFPPVINSAEIGAVQVGDEHLFIELTGTELKDLLLTASIVACDLADAGFTIEPVKIEYPFDTEFGQEITVPYYFQEPAKAELKHVSRLLGEHIDGEAAVQALKRMGIYSIVDDEAVYITVPEYRNDFLHAVDIVEDIMIGRGMENHEPIMPNTFTLGRLTPEEEFSRKVKDIMIGLGYQEMMYNYLGSKKDYIDKMRSTGEGIVQIANPMSENYEFVRNSIMPALLESESVSGNAVYPHEIFEIGKVAFLEPSENSGTATRNYLGFMAADSDMGFNQLNSHVSAVLFYMQRDYKLKESVDPRFIPGRAAEVFCGGKRAGVFGEIHPEVLENWGIQMPTAICELDLDIIMQCD
ncbi:MAG: phenylalanine--tRNA ligase subunit beta [Spirochaetales bacterium]|nr:phenylalanine--tRNA ligase subunit beta [Spirochaetales bacterium]